MVQLLFTIVVGMCTFHQKICWSSYWNNQTSTLMLQWHTQDTHLIIGNVQLYFILWQFCTLDGVANLDLNICHHKVTPVSPFCDELWAFVTKCDTCVTPYVTLQDTAVTILWEMLRATGATIPSLQNLIKTPSSGDLKKIEIKVDLSL